MKRVIVTGATGFLGRPLVAALAARGCEIIAVTRAAAPPGATRALSLEAAQSPAALAGADALIHLAAIAHRSASPAHYQEINVDLTERLARAAHAAGVPRFVFASSVKAVGEETHGQPWTEAIAPNPRSLYGRSKRAAEETLARIAGLNAVSLRMPLVHGPEARANFAALLRLADMPAPLPFANIANRRSLVSLPTATAAFIAAAAPTAPSGAFFIADRPALSTSAILDALRDGLGRPRNLFSLGAARPLLSFGAGKTLLQSLEVDDSAFRATFGYGARADTKSADALRETARLWRARGPAR